MELKTLARRCLLACAVAVPVSVALAKSSPEEIASLGGPKLSCLGAEKAGSADGVAEYTGKFLGAWPGQTHAQGYEPGPYADEKPLFTITAENAAQYAEHLTEGQKQLFRKYPQSYRMNVYASHRDFRFADHVCKAVKANAATAEVIHDGRGIAGVSGGIPFPFPKTGLEAVWNIINPPRAWTAAAVTDTADVYAGGAIAWGRQKFMTLDPGRDPAKRGSYQDPVGAYFLVGFQLPARLKDQIVVGFQPNDFSVDSTQTSWIYLSGLRRVRKEAPIGFDYPVPPAGLRTVDDDYAFNGSPERYEWKLIGKKEIYVPYNNFRVNDPDLKYNELLTANTLNPDYVRYELHRVWVVQGVLAPGVRHSYAKRELYADEDSWLAIWADNYSARGDLWRVTYINYFYSQAAQAFHRGVSVYHDLDAQAYEAGYLVNAAGKDWWQLNVPMTPEMFSPEAVARAGH